MSEINELFRELHFEVFKISVLHAFSDAIIFFLITLNITTLLGLKFYFGLILALFFISIDVVYRMKRTTLHDIEKANPQIKDILRTARDHTNTDNFMVKACFEELIEKMKSVSAGSLLNERRLITKIVAACFLSFAVIMISSNNIQVPSSVWDPNTYYKFFSRPSKERLDFYTIDFNETPEGLYGASDLTNLGNKTLEIQINPSINEMSFEEVKEPEDKEFERGNFPDEIEAVSDESSQEKLPKESKIAIAYNLALKEQGGN